MRQLRQHPAHFGEAVRFVGILGAAGVQWLASNCLGLTSGELFWACGAAALATGAYAAISRGRFIEAEPR